MTLDVLAPGAMCDADLADAIAHWCRTVRDLFTESNYAAEATEPAPDAASDAAPYAASDAASDAPAVSGRKAWLN